jgi:hypothetical protein
VQLELFRYWVTPGEEEERFERIVTGVRRLAEAQP